MTTSHLTNTPILAQNGAQSNTLEGAGFPPIHSNAWKRCVLLQQAAVEDASAAYNLDQAATCVHLTTRAVYVACAAEAEYLASVLRTVAGALWPPERDADLTPADLGIMAAFLDGLEPGQPLPPPLSRPEARPEES